MNEEAPSPSSIPQNNNNNNSTDGEGEAYPQNKMPIQKLMVAK
jgi:hypothetical protein